MTLPIPQSSVSKVCRGRVYSFWKPHWRFCCLCVQQGEEGPPSLEYIKAKDLFPQKELVKEDDSLQVSWTTLPRAFLYIQKAVNGLLLKWTLQLQHECPPLIHPDESLPSLIAKIWLSSGGLMPLAKWRRNNEEWTILLRAVKLTKHLLCLELQEKSVILFYSYLVIILFILNPN